MSTKKKRKEKRKNFIYSCESRSIDRSRDPPSLFASQIAKFNPRHRLETESYSIRYLKFLESNGKMFGVLKDSRHNRIQNQKRTLESRCEAVDHRKLKAQFVSHDTIPWTWIKPNILFEGRIESRRVESWAGAAEQARPLSTEILST